MELTHARRLHRSNARDSWILPPPETPVSGKNGTRTLLAHFASGVRSILCLVVVESLSVLIKGARRPFVIGWHKKVFKDRVGRPACAEKEGEAGLHIQPVKVALPSRG